MGVGVSAHRLAGAVAREGCVGTISSVDLRRHHPDLMRATGRSRDKQAIERANLTALDREIRAAREIADGRGMIAVNVMRAVSQYADYVRQSCASGADAIVVGAGLPFDLPELDRGLSRRRADPDPVGGARDRPGAEEVAAQGPPARRDRDRASALRRRPPRRGEAGGTGRRALRFRGGACPRRSGCSRRWASRRSRSSSPAASTRRRRCARRSRSAPRACRSARRSRSPRRATRIPNFKRVLAEAKPEDIVTFMSVAGLPARAVRTPWLARYLDKEAALQERARKRAAVHPRLRLPGAVRPARRQCAHGPVLHRPPPRRGAARRRRARAVLPRLRIRALRQPHRPVRELTEYLLGASPPA